MSLIDVSMCDFRQIEQILQTNFLQNDFYDYAIFCLDYGKSLGRLWKMVRWLCTARLMLGQNGFNDDAKWFWWCKMVLMIMQNTFKF